LKISEIYFCVLEGSRFSRPDTNQISFRILVVILSFDVTSFTQQKRCRGLGLSDILDFLPDVKIDRKLCFRFSNFSLYSKTKNNI